MPTVSNLITLLGLLVRALGFLAIGFALGRLVFDHFKLGDWRLQIAYVLGLFGLFIAVMAFSSPGSTGAFAFGVAAAYFMVLMPRTAEPPAASPREVA